ncbi:MAG: Crp/Fnr family transcriptional regulator [Gammaproteobacteria bacterium]|nr:Crp/Fnr family transcriptional regulator [Gammaproteobacteria bacterium]NIR98599.1 Crp/Fnr family transcriptional regulator [Gammaproteobacteria bacterium]NIT64322.1 Crp/Fnr family transcriptional regulator [Gammaproteobacteria bacterium]NIV21246.1 cyclic nucleotide-binding domain-containing protein [Gammaproteobacteria bacterium]NIX10950.1 cyclic nucleotide-binding domain-containing protein [Gammaproteobacteria bacterium]
MGGNDQALIHELRRVYLFDALSDKQLATVVQNMHKVRLEAKETLFEFGQPAQRFYLVRSGQIKLFRLSAEGDEKVIEVIRPGHTFAEAVMFMEKHKYPVSAEAIEPTELYSFDMASFTELLKESTQTCFRLMASMSRRLRARVEEINNLTLQNATYRLVAYLLQQLPEGAAEAPAIHLATPKSVIASRLSIQPETLSRILGRLAKKGLLSVHGSNITLHDVRGLRELI